MIQWALRLLAEAAQGGMVNALAKEGGLNSTFWAGPEQLSRSMLTGEVPIQGTVRQSVVRLKLGFSSDTFGYSISLGLPKPSNSVFSLDPEITTLRDTIRGWRFYDHFRSDADAPARQPQQC